MILTVRTTTGRENVVIKSLATKIRNENIPIKSIVHPEELRGYIFIEGELGDIEQTIQNIPHVRGILDKEVNISEIEKFLVPEKQEVKIETGDEVEIIVGPFKGEKGKIVRTDEQKDEVTLELLEAAIPIPVTISVNSLRLMTKKNEEEEKMQL
jgi:transcriptional antiterminator NusG